MSKQYVVALDQGTTSSRAVLFDRQAHIVGMVQQPLTQIYPQPGWVEHDPREILSTQLGVLVNLLVTYDIDPEQIDSIGITNQRETTLVWDRRTGEPIYNAIVWQCRRTTEMVEELCGDPAVAARITAKTGLIPDAYFSASKIKWILDTVEGAREAAQAGRLCFGTVDSWLVWSLTKGELHVTDPTNASRTMLYDIHKGVWDEELCDLFDIPRSLLPTVLPSSGDFGITSYSGVIEGVPLRGVAGDQQAALFGQCCFSPGQAKNTYGTGCFLLMNTGEKACTSKNNLITTIAASAPETDHTEYALEGSIFVAGALIQWLRDELGIISSAEESGPLAETVEDSAGVYVVPAFTGLGAPYWDAEARGAIFGLTRGTNRAHLVRAALESLAYQVGDLMSAMESDAEQSIVDLRVDGGACGNDFLMQFQSDILQIELIRPHNVESTATGAAFLAGLSTGFWKDLAHLKTLRTAEESFVPRMDESTRTALLKGWKDAIERTLSEAHRIHPS